ncbi:MAG: flagellar filament capping protein FliD [Mobilitalea sp.]
MGQAYNYMLEAFPSKREVKYPAHKRSELRKVYSTIVNLGKSSPLYKINLSKENQTYAIGVKETALALKSIINEMTNPDYSGFASKAVSISDEQVISANLVSDDTEKLPDNIEFLIHNLATTQTNRSKDLFSVSHALEPGEYNFSATIKDQIYQFTYNQPERETNQEVQEDITDFLNQYVPGITASVQAGTKPQYYNIEVISDTTGVNGSKNFSFQDMEEDGRGLIDFLGLDRTEIYPMNSKFELNGVSKQTANNSFTLENTLKIILKQTSDTPVSISIVSDSDKILNAVDSVLDTYNDFIRLAENRTQETSEHFRATRLISEMKNLENVYAEEMEACGLNVSEDGRLSIDESLAVQAAQDGGMESLFTRENGFIARLLGKAESIAINPMEYLDKTIVTYPNPYITSSYSGLFFSSYC